LKRIVKHRTLGLSECVSCAIKGGQIEIELSIRHMTCFCTRNCLLGVKIALTLYGTHTQTPPLKLRPYGGIEMNVLLLLLLWCYPYRTVLWHYTLAGTPVKNR